MGIADQFATLLSVLRGRRGCSCAAACFPLPQTDSSSFDKLLKRSEKTAALLERANNDLTRRQKSDLGKVLHRVIEAAVALGVQWNGS